MLRETHFAAMRINWEPKPQNLRSLAEELNLGLESFIFVDDSHHECMAVRTELPQVEVIQTPSRAVDIPACLDLVARLEILSLTAEDREKTQMYVQERKRKELATVSGDRASYLASLEMRLSVCIDDAGPLARLAQLTQKTNQFNLTTRRYDEAEVSARIASPEWIVAHFSLADIFGDSGVVGLAMIAVAGQEATLDTLLMSCRVIDARPSPPSSMPCCENCGREVSIACMQSICRHARTSLWKTFCLSIASSSRAMAAGCATSACRSMGPRSARSWSICGPARSNTEFSHPENWNQITMSDTSHCARFSRALSRPTSPISTRRAVQRRCQPGIRWRM